MMDILQIKNLVINDKEIWFGMENEKYILELVKTILNHRKTSNIEYMIS